MKKAAGLAWRIEFSESADADLRDIYLHILNSHLSFGHSTLEARDKARARVNNIVENARRLGRTPGMGSRDADIGAGLRHVTLDMTIFYFEPHSHSETVVVRAVFYSGQDHVRHMMARMGKQPPRS